MQHYHLHVSDDDFFQAFVKDGIERLTSIHMEPGLGQMFGAKDLFDCYFEMLTHQPDYSP